MKKTSVNERDRVERETLSKQDPHVDNSNAMNNDSKNTIESDKKGFREYFQILKSNIMVVTQIALTIFSMVTTIAFIVVSIHQSSQTREALDLARQNYIEENKPYVFTNYPTMHINYKKFVALLPVVNCGHTPAYGVNCYIRFQRSITIPDPRAWSYDSLYTRTLPPNSIDTMKFPQDRAYWDTSSDARFYLVGKIWYKSRWSNRLHSTSFVYEYIYLHDSFIRHYEYENTDSTEQYQNDI